MSFDRVLSPMGLSGVVNGMQPFTPAKDRSRGRSSVEKAQHTPSPVDSTDGVDENTTPVPSPARGWGATPVKVRASLLSPSDAQRRSERRRRRSGARRSTSRLSKSPAVSNDSYRRVSLAARDWADNMNANMSAHLLERLDYMDQVVLLNAVLKISNDKLSVAQQKVFKNRDRILALEKENTQLQQRHDEESLQLLDKLQAMENELKASFDSANKSSAALHRITGGIKSAHQKALSLRRDHKQLQTCVTDMLRAHSSAMDKASQDVTAALSKLTRAATNSAQLAAATKAKQLEAQLAVAHSQLSEHKTANEELQATNSTLASRVHGLEKQRRTLHEQVQELKGNIRVMVRVRPFTAKETGKSVQPFVIAEEHGAKTAVTLLDTGRHGQKTQRMEFDHVHGPAASQLHVFDEVSQLVTSVIDGFNVCVFAYGQTGSGKTYTMYGTKNSRGLCYHSISAVFDQIADRAKLPSEQKVEYAVHVGLLEVYNDQIFDLLADSNEKSGQSLAVQTEPSTGTVVVKGARQPRVHSYEDAKTVIDKGMKARVTANTGVHDHSSRSHCVLTLHVASTNATTGCSFQGKLHLVDLAGSENVSISKVSGQQLREAKQINRSLSALSDVFLALSENSTANNRTPKRLSSSRSVPSLKSPGQRSKRHVPYRNSKLTHLLSDSLGGNSKTMTVVCLNPGLDCRAESMNTLGFASRAKSVTLGRAKSNRRTSVCSV